MEEESLLEDEELKEFKRRVHQKKRVRGILIILNAIILAYLLYSIGDIAYSFFRTYFSEKEGDIILIRNKTEAESKEIYDQFIGETIMVNDYSVYGSYLHLSEYHMDASYYTSFDRLVFINVSEKAQYEIKNDRIIDKSHLDGGYDLRVLSEGDYIVSSYELGENYHVNEPQKILKLNSQTSIEKTIYTLPENGIRKRITIKNKITSPCLVISVKEVNSISEDYYDAVIIGNSENLDAITSEQLRLVKFTFEDYIGDIYNTKSSYAIILDKNAANVIASAHLSENDNYLNGNRIVSENALNNYDEDTYIRELGGSLTNAGYCLEDVNFSCDVTSWKSNNDFGKLTYRVNENYTITEIMKLLKL